MSASFADRISHYRERVTAKLDAVLPGTEQTPARLHEAMRSAVLNGGKRVRPLLVYAAGECVDLNADVLDAPAAAIELIHAFSLVHDDLPAMDDDDLRRGEPTLHRKYDEATAILAADALQPLAFSVLAGMQGAGPEVRVALVALLADACGSLGMTGGQALDLDAEGRNLGAAAIEHMYALKTGALIHASVMFSTLLNEQLDRDRIAALDRFGRGVGLAFQIKDDVLDVEGDTAVIGKPAGSDQARHKATYPGLIGIGAAKTRCRELLTEALDALDIFAARAEPLRFLARYIVERDN